jgi:hypothetical protein
MYSIPAIPNEDLNEEKEKSTTGGGFLLLLALLDS